MTVIDGQAVKTLTVRRIAHEDAASVRELSLQLGYEATVLEITGRIDLLLGNTEQVGLVACMGDEAVGWIEAAVVHHLQTPAHTLIGGLVVKDGLRGHGVGKRLCAAVEQWSRAQGLPFVRVSSRSTREAAHRFYRRDGYQEVKTSVVFEKVLSQD